jgi:hypothetical protein
MRWAVHVARVREMKVYTILSGKLEGERPLRRPRRRWEDNIRLCLNGRCLRHLLSSTTRTLGSWVRIPLEAWMCVRVCTCACAFFYVVLSCVCRGLASGQFSVQGVQAKVAYLEVDDILRNKLGSCGLDLFGAGQRPVAR